VTTPIIADTGGPDGDGPTLLEVLAALGIPRPFLSARDTWALLRRRGLIAYATTPHCPTCGYTTGFPPGWTTPQGNVPDPTPRPCQCWRLAELHA
jgi:hypothetical protein